MTKEKVMKVVSYVVGGVTLLSLLNTATVQVGVLVASAALYFFADGKILRK